MFGFLAPIPARLGESDRLVFSRHERAVEAALRMRYGLPARALASPDGAFISVLTAAQGNRATGHWPLPVLCCPPISPRDAGVRLAAAVTVILAWRKVEDDLADEPTGRLRWVERWLRSWRERARAEAALLGMDLVETDAAFAAQVAVERAGVASLAALAQATGQGMAALFAHTARLAGAEENTQPLRDLGAAVGELIFAVDAAADLAYDTRAGLANPLVPTVRPGRVPEERDYPVARRVAGAFARERLQRIDAALARVRLPRHQRIVRHCLGEALPARVEGVVAGGGPLLIGFRHERSVVGRLVRSALRGWRRC